MSQRIWCSVASNEEDEVLHGTETLYLEFCAFNQAAPGFAYKECKVS